MDKDKNYNDNTTFSGVDDAGEFSISHTEEENGKEAAEIISEVDSDANAPEAMTDTAPLADEDLPRLDDNADASLAYQDPNTLTDAVTDESYVEEYGEVIEEGEADSEELVSENEDKSEDDTVKAARAEKHERTVGTRAIDTVFDFLELFIFTFVFVLLATSFIFRHSVVSGPSMMNTLQDGDKLIISDLFYEPEYRDIIVVQDYSVGMTDPIVKRVIATEGQTVKITHSGVSVDGAMLDESDYIFTDGLPYSHLARLDHTKFIHCPDYAFVPGSFCEFTVPEGELFVLGDHRNISQDSYFYGCVREDAVLGKVIVRIYPNFEFFN